MSRGWTGLETAEMAVASLKKKKKKNMNVCTTGLNIEGRGT
jgi:hypothetical protein